MVKLTVFMTFLVFGFYAASGPVGAKGSDPKSSEIGPGVVIQADLAVVYVMRPRGGIEAVDCVTGKTIWGTTEVAKPLVALNHRLVVQTEAAGRRGVLPIEILDSRDGSKPSVTVEIPLRSQVRALIDQGLGVSFSARAWTVGARLMVTWEYLEYDVTGIAPAPGAKPFRLRDESAALVNLESGRIELLDKGAASRQVSLPEKVQQLLEAGELRKAPWRIGPILALAADRVTTEGPQVVLRRWDAESGAPLPDVKLFEGRPVARLPSADGRHLLISSLPEESSGAWERYLWSIFSLASGELVAEMRHHRSADRFSILGATLLHLSQPFGRRVGDEWVEEPLKLRAVDLGTGAERWNRALRDTAYRGPRPPSR